MKKLILLLFIPIFFACSDESADDETPNNDGKKLESFNAIYCEDCEGSNAVYSYENNQLTSVDWQYYITNGEGEVTSVSDGFTTIHHYDETVAINNNGVISEIPINSDGTIDSENWIFENGYLQTMIGQAGGGDNNFEWSNGNLINLYQTSIQGEVTEHNWDAEYSSSDDLTRWLSWPLFIGSSYFGFADEYQQWMIGLWGKGSNKLPSSIEFSYANGSSLSQYYYTFDDEGYPVQISISDTTTENGNTDTRTRVYEVTYTD